jgi:hypothetical protein
MLIEGLFVVVVVVCNITMYSVDSDARQCWVCFAIDGVDDNTTQAVWIHPCKCKGSTKWVHEKCLQRWIDEIQKGEVHTQVMDGFGGVVGRPFWNLFTSLENSRHD